MKNVCTYTADEADFGNPAAFLRLVAVRMKRLHRVTVSSTRTVTWKVPCVQRTRLLQRIAPLSSPLSFRNIVALLTRHPTRVSLPIDTMFLSRTSGAAFAFLAIAVSVNASFSNVQISQFQQAGLDLSFLVSWDTAGNPSTDSHLIDIWLETRQPDPSTFVETVIHKVCNAVSKLCYLEII